MTTKTLKIPAPERVSAKLLLQHSMPAQSWQLTSPPPMLSFRGMSQYRPTRREFLIGAGSLLVLAPYGCGGNEESRQGDETISSGTRTVEHAYDKVELPADPQRFFPGYTLNMDYALVLDIPMAAGTGARGLANQPFAEYQRERYPERLKGLEKMTTYPEANFEQIAAAEPDCILDSDSFYDENRYDRLSEIAPTFVYNLYPEVDGRPKPDWRGSFREVSRAFGTTDRADEHISDYEARAEEVRGRLAKRWAGATFAAVFPDTDFFLIHGRATVQPHQILFDDLGLTPAPIVADDEQELSLEKLPKVDADVLFIGLFPEEDSLERNRELSATYVDSPLWQKIPAVQKDQVYEFPQEILYPSPLTATAFLDYVERTLLA